MTPPASPEAPPSGAADRALTRLTPLGWRGGLAAIVAGFVLSFLLFGYFAIYWRNADMDFMVVYNALVLNDGLPKAFFDHPSYWTILSVRVAFVVLHALHLLDAWTLSAIPSAANLPAFDAAMTQAVRAGRVVALLTACGCVLLVAALARRALRDRRIALLATFAFAFSGGVAVHLRILRSEMIAATGVVCALLIIIAAARHGWRWRPLWLGLAATACVIGLENKVHAVVLIAALPVLGLSFGQRDVGDPFWRSGTARWGAIAALALAAALLAWLAWPVLATGYDEATARAAGLKPLFGRFGVYQAGLLAMTVAAVVAYAVLWRVAAAETVATLLALAGGAALGLSGLRLQFSPGDAVAVLNPLEKMLVFAPVSGDQVQQVGSVLAELLGNARAVLARYSFVLFPSARPTLLILWLVVPGIVAALMKGRRQVALQAVLLLGVAAGIDTLGISRSLKSEYFVFSDPFIIIAGALLLEAMPEVLAWRWSFLAGEVLLVATIVMAHPEPVKVMTKRSGPDYICEWNQEYQPLLPMPWCALPPVKP
jgi:hypothetical protein